MLYSQPLRERICAFHKGRCIFCTGDVEGFSGWIGDTCVVNLTCLDCHNSFSLDRKFREVYLGIYNDIQRDFEAEALRTYRKGLNDVQNRIEDKKTRYLKRIK